MNGPRIPGGVERPAGPQAEAERGPLPPALENLEPGPRPQKAPAPIAVPAMATAGSSSQVDVLMVMPRGGPEPKGPPASASAEATDPFEGWSGAASDFAAGDERPATVLGGEPAPVPVGGQPPIPQERPEAERLLAGIPPDVVASYRAAGIADPAQIARAAAAGFAREQIPLIVAYTAAGLEDYQKIKQYIEFGVPANSAQAIERNELGIHTLGVPLEEATYFKQAGVYPSWAAEGFGPLEALAYARAGFAPAQVREFRGSYLSPDIVRLYLDNQIPYCPDTAITGHITSPLQPLGHGAYNTVFTGDYATPTPGTNPPVSETKRRVMKIEPADDNNCPMTPLLGLRRAHPGYATHNIAAGKLNRLLGWHAVPDAKLIATRVARHGAPPTLALGIAMEFVPGTAALKQRERLLTDYPDYQGPRARPIPVSKPEREEAARNLGVEKVAVGRFSRVLEAQWREAVDINPNDPVLRRESIKSQLLDAIAGNGDPNYGNKSVELDPASRSVIGYEGMDYDYSFPTTIRDPNELHYDKAHPIRQNFRGCRLPTVVDRDMVADLNRLTAADMQREFSPLLDRDPGAAGALAARLEAVKAHVNDPARCLTIDPGDWDKPAAAAHFADANTSYIARDIAGVRAHYQARGRLISYEQAMR